MQARDLSLVYDAVTNLFGRPGKQEVVRAASVNTIDEVPDSSWFTNRRSLTAAEVQRGPNDDQGPAAGKWMVSRKANGVSPGFTITDSRGRRYFLKFDPPKYPELGTATEVIVTRLFHALGYWVPQTSIATLRREDLVIGDDAQVRTPGGGRRRMRESDIDEQLGRAHRNPDGTYRVVAGEAAPGTPLEGFKYEGTRSDDPNDVIPHEDRRELRGLRVFSAWVNHTDAKAINSLDTLMSRRRPQSSPASSDRLQRRARQRRHWTARAPRRLRVHRRNRPGRAGSFWIWFRHPAVDDDRLSQVSWHRPLRGRALRSREMATARAQPGVCPLAA